MSAIRQDANASASLIGWVKTMQSAGPRFAPHGVACDADDLFVSENYSALKQMGAFTAHIPAELGGGGASYEETAEMLRTLAHHCASTALALAMHTHLVAASVWRWHREPRSRGFCAAWWTKNWYW